MRAWLYRIATNVCLDLSGAGRSGARGRRRWPRCPGCSPTRTGSSTRSRRPTTSRTPSSSPGRRSSSRSSRLCRCCRRGSAPPCCYGTCSAGRRTKRPRCSTPASPRPTARCSAPARRCSSTCRRAAGLERPEPGEERTLLDAFIDAHERCDAAAAVAIAVDGHSDHDAAAARSASRGSTAIGAAAGTGVRRRAGGRLAAGSDPGQPDAGGRELPAPSGDTAVPRLQARRAPGQRRPDRRDHDVRYSLFPVRPAARAGRVRGRLRRGRGGRRSPGGGDPRPPPTVAAR